jgi:hypothetical protein
MENTLKNTLITFETAKLAKEQGFDFPVKNVFFRNIEHNYVEVDNMGDFPNSEMAEYNYSRPSQTILQEWLRMEHFIHIIVVPYGFIGTGGEDLINSDGTYSYFIYDNTEYINDAVDFQTYEDALEIALRDALKLVTEENNKIVK